MAITPIDRQVKVTVLRHGKQIELAVRIGDLKEAAKWLGGSVEQRLGAKSRPLTSKETKKYGLNRQQGVARNLPAFSDWAPPLGLTQK